MIGREPLDEPVEEARLRVTPHMPCSGRACRARGIVELEACVLQGVSDGPGRQGLPVHDGHDGGDEGGRDGERRGIEGVEGILDVGDARGTVQVRQDK